MSDTPAGTPTPRTGLEPWDDDVALNGPEAPKNNGHIKHLICYLLTVYKRFGDTAVTCELQWGASALWKRDELSAELAAAKAQLAEAISAYQEPSNRLSKVLKHSPYLKARQEGREECWRLCGSFIRPDGPHTQEYAAACADLQSAIRALKP